MSLKHTVFHRVNRPWTRRILELAGTAVASAQGDKAKISYDPPSGGWMKRPQAYVTLMPYPNGMNTVRTLLQDAGFTVKGAQDPRPWAAGYLFASR